MPATHTRSTSSSSKPSIKVSHKKSAKRPHHVQAERGKFRPPINPVVDINNAPPSAERRKQIGQEVITALTAIREDVSKAEKAAGKAAKQRKKAIADGAKRILPPTWVIFRSLRQLPEDEAVEFVKTISNGTVRLMPATGRKPDAPFAHMILRFVYGSAKHAASIIAKASKAFQVAEKLGTPPTEDAWIALIDDTDKGYQGLANQWSAESSYFKTGEKSDPDEIARLDEFAQNVHAQSGVYTLDEKSKDIFRDEHYAAGVVAVLVRPFDREKKQIAILALDYLESPLDAKRRLHSLRRTG